MKKVRPKKRLVRSRVKARQEPVNPDMEEALIGRISECQQVISELESSPLWRIVINDMELQRQVLDDNWQEITDPDKLQKARELKMATLHIIKLKDKYSEELESKTKELRAIQSTKEEVIKDYDTETNLEGGNENAQGT